jgi:hypothetical protein
MRKTDSAEKMRSPKLPWRRPTIRLYYRKENLFSRSSTAFTVAQRVLPMYSLVVEDACVIGRRDRLPSRCPIRIEQARTGQTVDRGVGRCFGSGVYRTVESFPASQALRTVRMPLRTHPAKPKIHPAPKIMWKIMTTKIIAAVPLPGTPDRSYPVLYGVLGSCGGCWAAAKCAARDGSDAPMNHPAAITTAAKRNTIR